MPRAGTYHGKPLLSNHQKSWLWGTIPVWETLHANRWPIYELVLSTSASQPIHQQCLDVAENRGITIRTEASSRLQQLCGSTDHQGLLALMGPFPYTPISQLLESVNPTDVIVLLDRLQDPFNAGAIIRSAAVFGVQGIVIGTESQVGMTSHVARSSAGTVNQLPVSRVENLNETVAQLQQHGYQILATTVDAKVSVTDIRASSDQQHPVVVIIGNEASGVSPDLLSLCDKEISIPMKGTAESLNAAVAAGVVLFELTK